MKVCCNDGTCSSSTWDNDVKKKTSSKPFLDRSEWLPYALFEISLVTTFNEARVWPAWSQMNGFYFETYSAFRNNVKLQ